MSVIEHGVESSFGQQLCCAISFNLIRIGSRVCACGGLGEWLFRTRRRCLEASCRELGRPDCVEAERQRRAKVVIVTWMCGMSLDCLAASKFKALLQITNAMFKAS